MKPVAGQILVQLCMCACLYASIGTCMCFRGALGRCLRLSSSVTYEVVRNVGE